MLHYQIEFDDYRQHLIHVTLRFLANPNQELWLPTWIPGSYLIREFSKHIESVKASDEAGRLLSIKKTEKKRLHQEKNKLHITPMGKQVSEFCNTYFPKVFDYSYTNTMETYLDEIEYGKMTQKEVLTSFISNLDHNIQETNEFHQENPDKIQKTKDTSLYCGKYQNEALYIKSGKYGYYLCSGKKTKISLNEFEGFSIEKKIASQTNEMNESEAQCLYAYIEGRKEKRNENICVELSSICSIRKSKYGYYIFYQTKQMKKPQFLKYNDEKDEYNEERMQWIETKNKAKIMSYVSKKYSINI